jgi:hypothetical protein
LNPYAVLARIAQKTALPNIPHYWVRVLLSDGYGMLLVYEAVAYQ